MVANSSQRLSQRHLHRKIFKPVLRRLAGVCPLNDEKLIGKPRPQSNTAPQIVATVECMSRMLEERRKMHTEDLLQCSRVLCNGFIDTSKGAVLTSDEAMRLIQKEEDPKESKQGLSNKKSV